MKNIYTYITLVLVGLLTGCVDDITSDFEFEEQIFISGLLTSEKGIVSVQIQKTVPVTDTILGIENNVKISLFTKDTLNITSLVSDDFIENNGEYSTSEIINPITGNKYWIEVDIDDNTILKSEEEILKPSIPIISMVKEDDRVTVTFVDQQEENNFYLVRLETFKNGLLIDNIWNVFNDIIVNDNLEEFLILDDVSDFDMVRASIYNINFNTFQFYVNVFRNVDDPLLSSLLAPTNVVGNVTNTKTNKQTLGNFGIAGFSTMTLEF